jgi:hypothetical protein
MGSARRPPPAYGETPRGSVPLLGQYRAELILASPREPASSSPRDNLCDFGLRFVPHFFNTDEELVGQGSELPAPAGG